MNVQTVINVIHFYSFPRHLAQVTKAAAVVKRKTSTDLKREQAAQKALLNAQLKKAQEEFQKDKRALDAMLKEHRKHINTNRHLQLADDLVKLDSDDARRVFLYSMGLFDPKHRPKAKYLTRKNFDRVYEAMVEKYARQRFRTLVTRYKQQMFGQRRNSHSRKQRKGKGGRPRL